MKTVLIDFPPGLRDYAAFDPLHTDEKPLFGADVGTHWDGRTRILYKGVREDLEEYVPLEIVITGIEPVNQEDEITVIENYDGKGKWFVRMNANIPVTVTCTYNGPNDKWGTPVIHPYGHTAYFDTSSVEGTILMSGVTDVAGDWIIKQDMINAGLPLDSQLIFAGLYLKVSAPQV